MNTLTTEPTIVSIDKKLFLDIEQRIETNDFLNQFGSSKTQTNQFVTKHQFSNGEFLSCELLQGKIHYNVSPRLLDQHLLTKKK